MVLAGTAASIVVPEGREQAAVRSVAVEVWSAHAADPALVASAVAVHAHKIPPEFDERLKYAGPDGSLQVMVSLDDRTAAVEAIVREHTRALHWYGDAPRFLAVATPTDVAALIESEHVLFLEPDYPLAYFVSESTVDVNARSPLAGTGVWAYDPEGGPMGALVSDHPDFPAPITGAGVTVAITDSGIDKTHRDFGGWDCQAGAYEPCESRILASVAIDHLFGTGLGLGEDLMTTEAASGHGTHVAGTIAGNGYYLRDGGLDPDRYGGDGLVIGVAPKANLVSVKNGDSQSAGFSTAALQWTLDHVDEYGIRVSSNSWGCLGGCSFNPNSATSQVVKDLYEAGVAVVFAVGNDGGSGSGNEFSGNAQSPYVIGVANYNDANHLLASGSSRGSRATANALVDPLTWTPESEGAQGVRRPDVGAPGTSIWSARTLTGGTSAGAPRIWGGDVDLPLGGFVPYATMSGTSMATPHVAGALALLVDACEAATPLDLYRAVFVGADAGRVKKSDNSGVAEPFEVGYGGLDVRASVDWLLALETCGGIAGPRVTITGPADGATVDPVGLTVAGIVDRLGRSPLFADAGGPYVGAPGAAIPIAGTATGGASAEGFTCAWSGVGATFADPATCVTSVTYAATGNFVIVLIIDDGTDTAGDTATVTVDDVAGPAAVYFTDTEVRQDASPDCGPTPAYEATTNEPTSADSERAYLGRAFVALTCAVAFETTFPEDVVLEPMVRFRAWMGCDLPTVAPSEILLSPFSFDVILTIDGEDVPDSRTFGASDFFCDGTNAVSLELIVPTGGATVGAGSTFGVEVLPWWLSLGANDPVPNLYLLVESTTHPSGVELVPGGAGESGGFSTSSDPVPLPLDVGAARPEHSYGADEALMVWQNAEESPDGPMLPDHRNADGIGPGSGLLVGNQLCTAAWVFQDSVTGTVYLATAGHCLMKDSDMGGPIDGTSPNAADMVEICFQDCIVNWAAGLDSFLGLRGDYLRLETTGTYDPVAFAQAEGVGSDFGLIEIPAAAHELLRPWLPQWGGPTGVHPGVLGFADTAVHFGHGTYCCEVVGGVLTRSSIDQGRVAQFNFDDDRQFQAVAGWASGGDSGSPVGHADFDRVTSKGVIGDSAVGVLTHGFLPGHSGFLGTLVMRGLDMAAAFNPAFAGLQLVLEDDAPGGGGGDPSGTPLADAGDDQVAKEGDEVTLDGACTDPEGDLASCAWSQVSGPTVAITDNRDGTGSFTAPDVDTDADVVVRLTATDAGGGSSSDDATVTVRDGGIDREHVELWVDGAQVGPDVPVGPTDDAAPAASWAKDLNFKPYKGRTVTVQARWYDAGGALLAVDSVTLTVRDRPNQEPSAGTDGPDEAPGAAPVMFDGSESFDPDGSIVAYAWDFGDGTTSDEGPQVRHAWSEAGRYTVRVTVTDDDGATATATREVDVR